MRKMSRSDGGAKYIKAAKTHTDKDGQPVRSHWLVLSQRVGDKVRHRTLLNLGTDYPVPKEKWKNVTELAEALLRGQPTLFEAEADVWTAAEDIVAKLRAGGFRPEAIPAFPRGRSRRGTGSGAPGQPSRRRTFRCCVRNGRAYKVIPP